MRYATNSPSLLKCRDRKVLEVKLGGELSEDPLKPRVQAAAGLAALGPWLYIADPVAHVIWRCPAGKPGDVSILAGRPFRPGFLDGAFPTAQFRGPQGLAAYGDESGDTLFVCPSTATDAILR